MISRRMSVPHKPWPKYDPGDIKYLHIHQHLLLPLHLGAALTHLLKHVSLLFSAPARNGHNNSQSIRQANSSCWWVLRVKPTNSRSLHQYRDVAKTHIDVNHKQIDTACPQRVWARCNRVVVTTTLFQRSLAHGDPKHPQERSHTQPLGQKPRRASRGRGCAANCTAFCWKSVASKPGRLSASVHNYCRDWTWTRRRAHRCRSPSSSRTRSLVSRCSSAVKASSPCTSTMSSAVL